MLRHTLAFALILAFACSSAQAEDASASQITDLKFLTVQSMDPNIPENIDAAENKFKFVRVIFGSDVDLPALSNTQHRDVHVSYYPCGNSVHQIHDSYQYDPSVYDSYGAVTRNRSTVKTEKLEKFKGLYYFYMPTSSRYAAKVPYIFVAPFDLYTEVPNMCFEIPGSADNFFSNEVRIPADALQAVLAKRPH